jgi:hypothetical protein
LFVGREDTQSTGAVGFAIVDEGKRVVEKLNYGGLTPLGSAMEVTTCVPSSHSLDAGFSFAPLVLTSRTRSSRGNIVLLLSGQNAAKTLLNEVNTLFGTAGQNLSAITRSEEKEKEFYAAVFERDPVRCFPLAIGGRVLR